MNINDATTVLRAAMRSLDESASPYGLYAIGEMPARGKQGFRGFVFEPTLAKLGYMKMKGRLGFRTASGQRLSVGLRSVSKIKVRKYGNAHRVDPHHDYAERWKGADLATYL